MRGQCAKMAQGENFDNIVDKILNSQKATPSLLKEVLQIELEKSRKPTEFEIAELQQKGNKWYNILPWAALFTLIGGISTALITGVFEHAGTNEKNSHEALLEDRRYKASVFDKLLVIDDLPDLTDVGNPATMLAELKKFKKEERRNRICLAAKFGIIKVPDYFIVAEKTSRNEYKNELIVFLDTYGCKNAKIPTSFPSPNHSGVVDSLVCPLSRSAIEANSLKVPSVINGTENIASTILRNALTELNNGIHEKCNPERLREYWATLDFDLSKRDPNVAWSGAFLSWLIAGSGNPNSLILSAANINIWKSGLEISNRGPKKIAFVHTNTHPRVGDIIFIKAHHTAANIEAIRKGEAAFVPLRTGIIHSVTGGVITYVGGNIRDKVSHRSISVDASGIIGYIRL